MQITISDHLISEGDVNAPVLMIWLVLRVSVNNGLINVLRAPGSWYDFSIEGHLPVIVSFYRGGFEPRLTDSQAMEKLNHEMSTTAIPWPAFVSLAGEVVGGGDYC